jgi:hypothetical protein
LVVADSRQTAIADAIADVTTAAQHIVDERLDLLRLQVRNDARRFLGAAVATAAGIGSVVVGVAMAAGAVVWTLALWMPTGIALAVVSVVSLLAGVVLTKRARKRIPVRLYDTPAIERQALP